MERLEKVRERIVGLNLMDTIATDIKTSIETPRVELLIFQTTPFCNIDCSYCYLQNRQDTSRIAPSVVSMASQSVVDAGWVLDNISVVWHAGEPLVVGPDYLRSLIDACTPLYSAVDHVHQCVQTNGILISDEFCRLFIEKKVSVGISVDGPRDLHDRHRRSRRGSGTFDAVFRGVERLRSFDIPFHVICVLTAESLGRAEELYTFFQECGAATVGFNVDEIEGANNSSSMSGEDYFERLSNFWDSLFRIHFERHAFHLREADDLIASLRYGTLGQTSSMARPFEYITVAVDGSVGTFAPELLGQRHDRFGNFSIGNIHSESMLQMAAGERFLRQMAEIDKGVHRCSEECSYFQVCGGGSPSNKISEHGTFAATETKFCRATKILVVDSLLRVAKEYRTA